MKFNNLGTTRVVFLIGKYAIKIPRCGIPPSNSFYGKFMDLLEGWKGNRNEYIWSNAKIYDYLCPVRLSLFFSFMFHSSIVGHMLLLSVLLTFAK